MTSNVYEIKTVNGRIFRVVTANENQENRLFKSVNDVKNKNYEKLEYVKCITSGLHNVKQFKDIVKGLI